VTFFRVLKPPFPVPRLVLITFFGFVRSVEGILSTFFERCPLSLPFSSLLVAVGFNLLRSGTRPTLSFSPPPQFYFLLFRVPRRFMLNCGLSTFSRALRKRLDPGGPLCAHFSRVYIPGGFPCLTPNDSAPQKRETDFL